MFYPVSEQIFELIQHGQGAEVAAALADHARLAEARNEQGISTLRMAVYLRQSAIRDLLHSRNSIRQTLPNPADG